jgi:DNA-binding NarL/FixJ family response regulator
MAERLFLSHNTVRNHVQTILRKLRVHSRIQAMSVAIRDGLVGSPGASARSGHSAV